GVDIRDQGITLAERLQRAVVARRIERAVALVGRHVGTRRTRTGRRDRARVGAGAQRVATAGVGAVDARRAGRRRRAVHPARAGPAADERIAGVVADADDEAVAGRRAVD